MSRRSSTAPSARVARLVLRVGLALFALVTLSALADSAELRARLRIEWGGGQERIWRGAIEVTSGRVTETVALGLEADEAGTIYVEDHRAVVRSRTPRVYDGVDLLVTGPSDAKLKLELVPIDDLTKPQRFELSLAPLLDESKNVALDGTGNRLLVRRAPGDKIRVISPRDHLVFAPGETWSLTVEPALTGVPAGASVRVTSRLLGTEGASYWNDDREWVAPAEGESRGLPLEVKLPNFEGVYDLVIQAARRNLTERIGLRTAPTDERRVQLIVVAPERASDATSNPAAQFETLAEIDPANPAWWERFTAWPANLPRIPNLRRGPLGNDSLSGVDHPLGKLARLGTGGTETEIAWEAYPLPIARPGQPHIVEIEYPSEARQAFGISIVEPNVAGIVAPVGLDSGVYQALETEQNVPTLGKHRLLFWPRTSSPLLLITNRRPAIPATYGKIRLLGRKSSTWPGLTTRLAEPEQSLPRAFPDNRTAGRKFLAYYDRPLFPENFGAPQAADAQGATNSRPFDDWQTFRLGGKRLVEYLNHVGYNGVILSTYADGSTIYPSRLVEPTPRYDDGQYFATGQDLHRKDVLELLFRLCDREQLALVPAVQFTAPLVRLEQLKRADRHAAAGIDLVGSRNQTWTSEHAPRQGLAPYYNPLDPRVQQAMTEVILELIDRYQAHPSFQGISVQLTSDGYGQFPGVEWGLDARTVARFLNDCGLLAAQSPERSVEAVLSEHRPLWIAWRAQQLSNWYRQLGEIVEATKPGAKLYLATGDLLHHPELERELRPTLLKRQTLEQLWASQGLDPTQLHAAPGVMLLRPQREGTAMQSLVSAAADLEFNAATAWDTQFVDPDEPGYLFFHPPQEARLASFEAKSPFKKTNLRLMTHASPSGALNRQRFAHALAKRDAGVMADGGWMLPLGQEEELKELIAAYRGLPEARFRTLQPSTSPVTIRTFSDATRSYFYLVNDSPWKATVTLSVVAPEGCRLDPIGTTRRFPGLQGTGDRRWWTIDLVPFDVVAGVFSSPEAQISDPTIRLPVQATERLDQRIHELWARAATLHNPPLSQLIPNADFEVSLPGGLAPADWESIPRAGSQAKLDESQRHGGRYSLQLNAGSYGAELRSRPIPAPASGRLSLSVWLRVQDEQRQPQVRIGVSGEAGGQPWSRASTLGAPGGERLHANWTHYQLDVADWPSEPLHEVRMTIELVGPGQVWVDDLDWIELDFSEAERLELSKTITAIEYQRKAGDIAECLRMLDGYWPQFLRENVPLSDQPVTRPPPVKTSPVSQSQPVANPEMPRPPAAEPRPSGVMDRIKRFIPRWSR